MSRPATKAINQGVEDVTEFIRLVDAVVQRRNKTDDADEEGLDLMDIMQRLAVIINRQGVDRLDAALRMMARSKWHARSVQSARQVLAVVAVGELPEDWIVPPHGVGHC